MVPTEANVIASIGAELLRDTQDTTKEDRKIENHGIGSDAIVLCAIATQIAVENVSAAPQALMLIARIARCLDKDDERKRICRMVAEKIRKINNSNYLQIWAQQLTIEDDRENDPVPYDEPLCSIAIGQKKKLWNNDWLKKSLTKGFEDGNIIVPDKATDNASETFPILTLEDLTGDFIDIDFAELERVIKEGKGKVLFPCQF